MDAVTISPVAHPRSGAATPIQDPTAAPPVPVENRLLMPAQSLTKFDRFAVRSLLAPQLAGTPWLSRLVTFGGGFALTVYGGYQMYKVIDVGGVTTLKWALLALFVLNFSWIALSFASCIVGFAALLFRRKPPPRPTELSAKTAVVMPIYNEAPSRVFAALQAIYEDVAWDRRRASTIDAAKRTRAARPAISLISSAAGAAHMRIRSCSTLIA
jgi:membrane glycosyltransferase